MPAQRLVTQRHYTVQPQYVVEGHTPATYGVTPTLPVYVQALADASLEQTSSPTTAVSRQTGDPDRQQSDLVRKGNSVVLRGKLQDADESLLTWATKKPDGLAGGPDESRTFLNAYKNSAGNTVYQVWKGCKPTNCVVSVTADYTTVELTMSYLSREETETAQTTLDSSITHAPLTQADVPSSGFSYNGSAQEFKTGSVTVSYEEAMQDSAGSVEVLYRSPATRTVSGSLDLFKTGGSNEDDAEAHTARAAVLRLSASITLTFAGLVWEQSGEDVRGDSSEATMETRAFTADSVTVS